MFTAWEGESMRVPGYFLAALMLVAGAAGLATPPQPPPLLIDG